MKRNIVFPVLMITIILALSSCRKKDENTREDRIILENAEMRLVIGSDAKALSLVHKPTGQECLQPGINIPAFTLTQYRPYDNELQLIYPAKSKTFAADTVYRKGDDLIIGFEHERNIAVISVKITDHYIGFNLKKFDYDFNDVRRKRKTEIDECVFLQLPVRDRKYFGEWLNVSWDDDVAVNLLATGPYTKIDAEAREGYHVFKAGVDATVKMEDVGVALIATSKENLLDRIDQVEINYSLPRGVMSRRSDAYKYSYYETRDVNLQNIDKHIEYAKKGGFRTMCIYYMAFAKSMGHFQWKPEYPNGMADLQAITKKIKDAGIIPGFHIHYNKVMKNDLYVSPTPDSRLNLTRKFTLKEPIDKNSEIITVEEKPSGCTLDDQRRLLKIGNEIIEYESYTDQYPYQFTGCKRGALGTKPSGIEAGRIFGLLDVDTWPAFIRVDQNTSLQQELAERIGEIYNEAGFEFVYFDGAEDIPPPYWFNTSIAQLKVYNCLNPAPIFSEGALKSHFGWHILSRGNAFDTYKPEVVKDAIRKYQCKAADYIAKDFSSINFGWIYPYAPNENSTGMQPDMLEYICSRGAAWDCPVSLIGEIKTFEAHARADENLEVIRRWEDARIQDFLTNQQKEELKNPNQEHILLVNETGGFELLPYSQVKDAAGSDQNVRAFIFERGGKSWVVYWHVSGKGKLKLSTGSNSVRLFKELSKQIPLQGDKEVIVPLEGRHYLEFNLPYEKVIQVLEKAEVF